MTSTVVTSNHLELPKELAKKLKGKRVTFIETETGILLKPVEDPIHAARGSLKGLGFTTEEYMAQKKEEKNLE